ncbi:MAG TPA: hypothetical protein VGO34_08490 [Alphaproteobacteria bacterium]
MSFTVTHVCLLIGAVLCVVGLVLILLNKPVGAIVMIAGFFFFLIAVFSIPRESAEAKLRRTQGITSPSN